MLATDILNLDTQDYIITIEGPNQQSMDYSAGILYVATNNKYVLDIKSETLNPGTYTIWIKLDKQNYVYKRVIFTLTVNSRDIDYELGDMFEEKQTTVVKGKTVTLSIELTDPTKGDNPLTGAEVILEIGDDEFEFEEVEDGLYELEFETDEYDAFFTSKTITGTIKISKANYSSEDVDITIVIEMEELEMIPDTFSMPLFYFLILLIAIIAIVGSLATYKYIQLSKIPEYVKKIRAMKSTIKDSKLISDTLSITDKDTYLANIYRDKWEMLDLSIEEILEIEIVKGKTLPIIKGKGLELGRDLELMPRGLILMRWDPRIGTEIVHKYPEDIDLSKKTLMQIYGAHEYTGESGRVNLMVGSLNISSYYTGKEKGYYLVLLLDIEDDADAYEGAMVDTLQLLLQNLEEDAYKPLVPHLFRRLAVYPTLNNEQILIHIYQDEVKRIILNRLRDEAVIAKSELMVWLKDKYQEGFIDLDAVLTDLIKKEFVKMLSVKGMPSELNFLTGDLLCLRIPPKKLLKSPEANGLPSQLTQTYVNEVKKFFEEYIPSESDNVKIVDILAIPEVYQTFQLLRQTIATKDDLEKLKKKGVENLSKVLKLLWENKMILVLQDKNGFEYYALISDFSIELVFPKYILNIVRDMYRNKSQSSNVLIEYLDVIEDTYLNLKERKKQK
jgi:hypothetical protein